MKAGIETNVTIRIEGTGETIPCASQADETLEPVLAELGNGPPTAEA